LKKEAVILWGREIQSNPPSGEGQAYPLKVPTVQKRTRARERASLQWDPGRSTPKRRLYDQGDDKPSEKGGEREKISHGTIGSKCGRYGQSLLKGGKCRGKRKTGFKHGTRLSLVWSVGGSNRLKRGRRKRGRGVRWKPLTATTPGKKEHSLSQPLSSLNGVKYVQGKCNSKATAGDKMHVLRTSGHDLGILGTLTAATS